MSAEQLILEARYVTDADGHRSAVQLDLNLWQQILDAIRRADELEAAQTKPQIDMEEGWQILLDMANDATPGKLDNAAEDHDHYLYPRST